MKNKLIFGFLAMSLLACKKEDVKDDTPQDTDAPKLVFRLKLDPNQERTDNLGNPAPVPANHGAQDPSYNAFSIHYIELAQNAYTQLQDGEVCYTGAQTTTGGDNAIDYDKAIRVNDGEILAEIPIADVKADTYEWIRVSVSYQNADIEFRANGIDATATLACFLGFNTYITEHVIKTQTETVNSNKLQGYWALEIHPNSVIQNPIVSTGESGQITVPNPLAATSPIPPGSCVLTGDFEQDLVITGNETEDVIVDVSFSTNKSIEWYDAAQNNIFEPLDGDSLVDMGIRGVKPIVVQ